jgi:hypothetical protein
MTTKDTDMGANAYIARMRSMDGSVVKVGILDDPKIAFYAFINEFGSRRRKIPERSFLRATIDSNQAKYDRAIDAALGRIADGKDPESELQDFADMVADDVLQAVLDFKEPANHPDTVRIKGFDDPLFDSGDMAEAIKGEVKI